MDRRRVARWVLGLALLAGAASGEGWAHHGWSSYDEARPLSLTGTVEEASFEHPHAAARVRAEGRSWLVVLPPPTRAVALGVTRELLRPGVRVTVEGYPHRRQPNELRAVRLVVDEQVFRLR
ncbi:MAG: DUF6152 family protein [Armatimonadota bacterium]|nr:DUF6152 family protein [Armatimonadota bacterium]MDW8156562.1 DUF6152 family protein [Armatimonadota bacterium]